ncbi:MAG TPA: hypothetical protein PLQ05_10345 [Acidobacteriota bacterium]|nr:hypothetical protein [Acidobacteriota bacterium]
MRAFSAASGSFEVFAAGRFWGVKDFFRVEASSPPPQLRTENSRAKQKGKSKEVLVGFLEMNILLSF